MNMYKDTHKTEHQHLTQIMILINKTYKMKNWLSGADTVIDFIFFCFAWCVYVVQEIGLLFPFRVKYVCCYSNVFKWRWFFSSLFNLPITLYAIIHSFEIDTIASYQHQHDKVDALLLFLVSAFGFSLCHWRLRTFTKVLPNVAAEYFENREIDNLQGRGGEGFSEPIFTNRLWYSLTCLRLKSLVFGQRWELNLGRHIRIPYRWLIRHHLSWSCLNSYLNVPF